MKRPSSLMLCLAWLVLSCIALFGPIANGQGTITFLTASVRVLDELELPPLSRNGGSILFRLPPGHLDGGSRDRYRTYFVLAPNTNPYPFVLDATSRLPAGPAFTYEWSYFVGNDSDGDFFHLAGPSNVPYYTNQPPYLSRSAARELHLEVRNNAAFDHLWFGVVVLTPQSATDEMIEWLLERGHGADRPRSRLRRRILPPLREASAHFEAGGTEAGKEALRVFQRRIKALRYPLTRGEARVFKALSQKIIDIAAD